jgi:hypothetical protein
MNRFFLFALTLTFCLQAVSSVRPIPTDELRTAVYDWCDDEVAAITTYGDINTWDTSFMKGK